MTLDELYASLLKTAAQGGPLPQSVDEADPRQIDCLLNPKKYAPVWAQSDCTGCKEGKSACCAACLFRAIGRAPDGKISIDPTLCSGCAACLEACRSKTLAASRDALPALYDIKHANGPVYALIAPAFQGQFSPEVTPGKLRAAFAALGFTGMVEVALFADILTLKEALEFDRNIHSAGDFQLTSCCCPVWISMIRRIYSQLMPHVPGAVSPMIAAGRTVKALHPDALTVFIGPCLAKKAEAREPDLAGAVDWVLTFEELRDIFRAADIRPEDMEDIERGHSSRAGRIYAYAGGVSEAVSSTVRRLYPDKKLMIKTCFASGVAECRAMIEKIQSGEAVANFYEGMGCTGGCVGGPKAILDREQGRKNVERYGSEAEYATPLDNPYTARLLKLLGFETVEDFLANSDIFTRRF